jgi:hypothetical protein
MMVLVIKIKAETHAVKKVLLFFVNNPIRISSSIPPTNINSGKTSVVPS